MSSSIRHPVRPPLQRRVRCVVRPPDRNLDLLAFLSTRFTYHNSTEWASLIKRQRVLVNGRSSRPDSLLQAGDQLEYLVGDQLEPPVNPDYQIVYEDDSLLVVDKPGNLPTHPAGKYFNHTLWALLKRARPDQPIHFVNRLDRETSGLVLVAKTAAACTRAAAALADPAAEKVYLAIVEGVFPDSLVARGTIVARPSCSGIRKKYGFLPHSPFPAFDPVSPGIGRPATTSFRRVRDNRRISLVEASLANGRTHQIRATLEKLGWPLVGDKLYGVDETIFLRFIAGRISEPDRLRLRLDRQALHAARLFLPQFGQFAAGLTLVSPLPEDMRRLLR